ncbi:MAG: hypothetical protein ABWY08_04525 [Comamonas sp.]
MVAPEEKCSACGQTLWSVVRHCPFCGALTAAHAVGVAGLAAEEPAAAPQPTPEVDVGVKPAAPAPTPEPVGVPSPAAPAASEKPAKPPAVQAPAPQVQSPASPQTPKSKAPGGAGTPAVPAPRARKRSHKLWIGVALVGVLAYGLWNSKPAAPDACDQALSQVQSAMQQEHAQQARQHAQAAIAACKDKERARLAKNAHDGAQALLKTQAQAQARAAQQQRQQQLACESSNRQIAGHLRSGRLVSAWQNLQRLEPACREMGETQALIAQFEGMRATAGKATVDARAQLAQGALAQARTSLEVLASVNRESDDLPELRAVLNKARQAPVEGPGRPASESGAQTAAQSELLRSFLRDAENSMQQRLYDRAKTYAESAQRIDPRNPEVARLLRRIKEHEMSYLRERIVIE